jgi:hypothetical protein
MLAASSNALHDCGARLWRTSPPPFGQHTQRAPLHYLTSHLSPRRLHVDRPTAVTVTDSHASHRLAPTSRQPRRSRCATAASDRSRRTGRGEAADVAERIAIAVTQRRPGTGPPKWVVPVHGVVISRPSS